MADLTTLTGIEAELAATADCDVALDVSKAKRRVAALRRKLAFPQSSGRGEQNIAFVMQTIENHLQRAFHSTPRATWRFPPHFQPLRRRPQTR